MKYVLVIPDGMGDRPVRSLGGETPLEAARTPNMDYFAFRGRVGTTRTIPPGHTPGTDIGSMSLFGYDPKRCFAGRGPLEAAVHGLKLAPDDLAFRCNLVTLERGLLKDFSAGHIPLADAAKLMEGLKRRATKKFGRDLDLYAGLSTGYRHLAIVRGAPRALAKVRFSPPHDIMGRSWRDHLPAHPSAKRLVEFMAFSREYLENHPINERRRRTSGYPANSVWLWGQGFLPRLSTYRERFGLKGGVITAVDLLKGIALHAGLRVIRVPGVTGYFDTNYAGKASYALRSLKKSDFVAIHVESTDEAGHMGDPAMKIKAIEDIDRHIMGALRKGLPRLGAHQVLVVPDHFTCVETRTHSSDPVPFLVYSTEKKRKGPKKFSERSARASGLVVKEGHRLMNLFVGGKLV